MLSALRRSPLTIIEGNHRVAAALLISDEMLRSHLRFFCGLSPRMTECCWYHTSLANLWRYARNKLRHVVYDPEAEMERALQVQAGTPAVS